MYIKIKRDSVFSIQQIFITLVLFLPFRSSLLPATKYHRWSVAICCIVEKVFSLASSTTSHGKLPKKNRSLAHRKCNYVLYKKFDKNIQIENIFLCSPETFIIRTFTFLFFLVKFKNKICIHIYS